MFFLKTCKICFENILQYVHEHLQHILLLHYEIIIVIFELILTEIKINM